MKQKSIYLFILYMLLFELIKAQGAGNVAQFSSGGSGSSIIVPSSTELKTFTAITVEVWIKPNGGGGEYSLLIGKQLNGSDSNPWYSYRLRKSNYVSPEWPDNINFNVAPSGGGVENAVTSSSKVQPNVWTHIAGVYDGSELRIYLNGQLQGTTTYSSGINANDLPLYIGRAPWTTNNNFDGQMDEARIWNVARTQTEIQNYMYANLSGSETGLVAYWPFNETAGSSTVDDASSNSNTGTLGGAASIASNSTAPVGSNGAYVSTTSKTSVGPTGGELSVTITSTPDNSNNLGIHQTGSLSGSPVTTETFPSGVDKRSEILWGINEIGSVTATLELNYGGIGGISNESNLKLLKRSDASSAWADVTSDFTQNTTDHTFTQTGVTSFSQFSIGSGSDNALPVELSSFSAKVNEDKVELKWQTATEVNNHGFEIQRKILKQVQNDNSEWTKIGFVKGAGNSSSPKSYSFTDQPTGGTSFSYRIKQIDNDAKFKYYDAITVKLNMKTEAELMDNYPNPFNPSTSIKFYLTKTEDVSIKIYDMLGKEVTTLFNKQTEAGYYLIFWNGRDRFGITVASGTYIYKITAGSFSQTKKMVLLK